MGSRCAALLLSGGGSRRWDRHPKALIPVRGRPALEYMAGVAFRAGCDPIVAVTGPGQALAEASLGSLPVRIVHVVDAPGARTGSVQAGLAALPTDLDLLLWPVDHPFVRAETVTGLLAARTAEPSGSWWVPEFCGKGGHPVVIGASVLPRIRALRADDSLREARPDDATALRRLPVDDPGVVANIDAPDAYRSFLESAAARGESW
ncbi:MAG: nucleotidyltransferase family protein [Thermoplasmata archaeon]